MPRHLSLDEQYSQACEEQKQPENPYIVHVLQEVNQDEEALPQKITIKIAGNNRLVPVQKVTDVDFQILASVFTTCAYLTGLDLRYNLLTDAGAVHIAAFLQDNRILLYLNLMFNDIGTIGAEFIAKALHRNETLLHLRMTGNKIDNMGGMYFAAMMQINNTIQKIDFADCDLGTQSLIALATVLNQNESIKAINLNRPILYSEQEETTVHTALMLKANKTLVELHLCKHEMKNFGVERLCEALYENTSLRYLDLSCNKITRDGVRFLGELLKQNNTLEILDLNFNRIENDGAFYLSAALTTHNRTLQALAVTNNSIAGEGLVALAEAMKTNPVLSYIYIWGNKFDEATCVIYCDGAWLISEGKQGLVSCPLPDFIKLWEMGVGLSDVALNMVQKKEVWKAIVLMAFAELLQTGRLKPTCTDVEPYVVDGCTYLAEVSHGLKRHYYWTPSFGEVENKDANASLAIAPVTENL